MVTVVMNMNRPFETAWNLFKALPEPPMFYNAIDDLPEQYGDSYRPNFRQNRMGTVHPAIHALMSRLQGTSAPNVSFPMQNHGEFGSRPSLEIAPSYANYGGGPIAGDSYLSHGDVGAGIPAMTAEEFETAAGEGRPRIESVTDIAAPPHPYPAPAGLKPDIR